MTQVRALVYRTLPWLRTVKYGRHLFPTRSKLQGFPESKRPIRCRERRRHREAVLIMLAMFQASLFGLARDALARHRCLFGSRIIVEYAAALLKI